MASLVVAVVAGLVVLPHSLLHHHHLLDAFLWRILWGVRTVLSSQQRMDEGGGSLLILVMTVMVMVTIMMVMMVIPVFSLVDVEWESVDQRLLNSWLQDL